MIDRFRTLFASTRSEPEAGRHAVDELQLAAAVLLVEAARLDEVYDDVERDAIDGALRRKFGLDATEAATLIAQAESTQDDVVEMHRFTRTIKDRFSAAERIEMIEMLWEVVYADGELHPYEANLMRRLGDCSMSRSATGAPHANASSTGWKAPPDVPDRQQKKTSIDWRAE